MSARRLRIAYVINSVEGGGAASPVPAIVKVLAEGGAAVKVFALTGRDRRGLPAMRDAGVDVAVRDGGERDQLAALRWLDRELRAWQPTHVWTSLTRATLFGQLVGLRHGWPVVSWQHAAFLKPANRRLLRATQRLSHLWIGDSLSVTRLTAERLAVPAERLTTWPIFGADPAQPRATPWQPDEAVRIASLGRLHPVKGYDVLIDALAQLPGGLPPFRMTIAGDGAEHEALSARAAAAGVTVEFAGYLPNPRQLLASSHMYIQPSRSEGFCVAAHEAMAAGLPVVASRVGELAETVVDGVTGALVPPGDADALAQTLSGLLARPDKLAEMGAAAQARVSARFGAETFRANGLAILERLRAM